VVRTKQPKAKPEENSHYFFLAEEEDGLPDPGLPFSDYFARPGFSWHTLIFTHPWVSS
jgi:hypothetical protein